MVISGVLAFLLMSTTVWAEGQYRTIEVFFAKIDIAVNGKSMELSKQSIVYDGSVYVPLRNLSELMGAKVSWDDANSAVHLDFIYDQNEQLFNASQNSLYQYIALEHNLIMKDMIEYFNNDDMDAMKSIIERYRQLRSLAQNMHDADVMLVLDKLTAAIEIVRSGWSNKDLDEYYLAWSIYTKNVANLNKLLQEKVKGEYSDKSNGIGIESSDF